MASAIKQLAGETVLYGLSHVGPRLLQFFFLAPYLTRVIGSADYGIHGTMYAYAAFFIVLFTFRMETAFFRYAGKNDDPDTVFSTALLGIVPIILAGTGIMILFDEQLTGLLARPGDERYIYWFLGIIALDALAALPFARLRLENKAKRFAHLKLLNVIATLVLAFFMLEMLPWLGRSGWSWAAALYDPSKKLDYVFLANLMASGLILVLLYREFRFSPALMNRELLNRMYRYSWPLVLVSITGVISLLFDRIFIKAFIPGDAAYALAQSGIYNACVKIAVPMSLFATAFNYAAEPFFFKNAEREDAKKTYADVALAFAVTGTLVFLGGSLFLDQLQYIIGAEYREGVGIVPIVLLAYLFMGLYYNFSIWYKLTDRTIFGTYISFIGAAITIGLNIVLIPKLGYYGSAWAVLICFLSMCAFAYYWGLRYYPIEFNVKKMGGYIITAVATYALSVLIVRFWDPGTYVMFVVNAVLWTLFLMLILKRERLWGRLSPALLRRRNGASQK